MFLLATTALEAMKHMPARTWMKIVIGIAGILVSVFVVRKVAKMNKIILSVFVLVIGSVVFFSWVYNRNEPEFLTPLVDRLAPFFPTAGAYENKQQSAPKH